MAIPSRQIGWGTQANLLWQISKQLERLICVAACECPTTTTTTTLSVTNYNVAGCERMEYHVISYTGEDILPLGTIVQNETPECWYIIDQTTDPADVGTVQIVWNTLGNCNPCIDSHPTTTTTTTATVYFFDTDAFSPDSNYGVCYQPQGNPGLYSLSNTLGVGVQIFQEPELINPSLDGWYIYSSDVYVVTGGNGFITQVGINCGPLLFSRQFVSGSEECGQVCGAPYPYITVWVTDNCNDSWPQIGCRVYLDALASTWLPEGAYNQCNGLCIQIDANGYIIGT